jgi:putative photosynthetic complex assembly protein
MSHAGHHDPIVPPAVLAGAGALLLAALAMTGAVSLGLMPRSAVPDAQQRSLRFADRADGAVVISDAASGATVKVIGFGEGGFVRATMRRMARARAAAGIGAQPPFTLVRWDNGALTLRDPATGRSAEIHGFGADHSRAFAEMLDGPA